MLLFVLALLLFACMDTAIKYLATHHEAPLVVAVRYIVHCLLMVVLLGPTHRSNLVRTERPWLVLARAACLAVTSLFVALALQRMPVAEMTAINFLAPMIVVLLARPVLGERIGLYGWLAAVAGFAGVLLIVRPGGGLDPLGVVFMLCSVAASVVYQLLSRLLAHRERTLTMLFYAAVVGAVGFGATLPWYWPHEMPSPLDTLLFIGVGLAAGFGHFLYTAAYRHSPASFLAPLTYLQLLWAGLLGWLAFGDIPDRIGLLGMAIVAASGLLVALKGAGPSGPGRSPALMPPAPPPPDSRCSPSRRRHRT